jgi:hypothetical protein
MRVLRTGIWRNHPQKHHGTEDKYRLPGYTNTGNSKQCFKGIAPVTEVVVDQA